MTLALTLLLLCSALAAAANRVEYDYFKYHNMEEISKWKTEMATANKDIVTVVEYGKTYEKRTIDLLKIGVPGTNKKSIWMDCGIHAREWISPAFCQYFVKTILEMRKTDSKVQLMMKNMDIYVTPVLNVDGYTYTWANQSNRLWRKNRSPGPSGCNCTGTDLNRNYNTNWGTVGVDFDCCSITYPGPTHTSELETQAVKQFVEKMSKDVLAFLTIHSYGQLLLIPYGHPEVIAPNQDELMEVGLAAAEAIEKVHGMKYKVGTGPKILYSYSGSSGDWARLQGVPLSYTFELRDTGIHGFELPEDQIQPAVEEAFSGAMHIITYAHDKAFNITGAAATGSASVWTTLLVAVVTRLTL